MGVAGTGTSKALTGRGQRTAQIIQNLLGGNGIYGALLLLVVIASLLSPNFLSSRNLINIVRTVSINGIVAVGMTLLILCGKFDLSVGVIVSMAGVVAVSLQSIGMWPAILLGLFGGALVGAVNGVLVAYVGINAFIATLATQTILLSILLEYTQSRFLTGHIPAFTIFGQGNIFGLPYLVIAFLLIVALGEFVLRRTHFGRYIRGLGGNEEASRWSGIMPKRVVLGLFILMGVLAAVAGLLLSSRLNYGASHLGEGQEFDAITAVLLGGTKLTGGEGSVTRTLIGVLILGILTNILQIAGFAYELQLLSKGLVFVLVIWLGMASEKR